MNTRSISLAVPVLAMAMMAIVTGCNSMSNDDLNKLRGLPQASPAQSPTEPPWPSPSNGPHSLEGPPTPVLAPTSAGIEPTAQPLATMTPVVIAPLPTKVPLAPRRATFRGGIAQPAPVARPTMGNEPCPGAYRTNSACDRRQHASTQHTNGGNQP